MIEQGIVDLSEGGGIREGGEARCKPFQRKLFYGPYRPRGGRS